MILPPDDPRHGTINGYTNHWCMRDGEHCAECRAAMSSYYRQLRGGTKAKTPGRFGVAPSTGNGRKTTQMVKLEVELGLAFSEYDE